MTDADSSQNTHPRSDEEKGRAQQPDGYGESGGFGDRGYGDRGDFGDQGTEGAGEREAVTDRVTPEDGDSP